ncbi:EF-hand calcium-binding domain-containing protein 14 isoform X2 [Sinocyclocheilus anshuiensis]|uniref:EF-hand calcium-binding domain-containing protein 14 isoform X2 n=1 Tax=Sinocyclocheilus anshuiensis TaxID=1608454 RepID=UPI0007B9189E|nr:PREDICTED: EF-hand calcium-binding domain-containing protein 14-like isoform X2 [Sinocyclocheilus anshuiensis]
MGAVFDVELWSPSDRRFTLTANSAMSPQKKMKKRKELNALIGLSDSSQRKSKQSCGHRLLRTEPPESEESEPESESESGSEEQQFGGRSGLLGKTSLRCCSLCYPLCVFVVLAACVMACAGLIWMQIALKEDLDSMNEKIHTMESSQKLSSHEILKLSEDLKAKQMKLDELESGDKGLAKLWSNLSEINQKLSALDSAVNHLKANIKSASDLIALPRTVEELQKSVASIGSTVTSVQHDVTMIQSVVEERRKGEDQLKANGEKPVNISSSCVTLKQDLQYLQDDVKELNSSLLLHQSWSSEQIQSVRFVMSNLSRWVSALDQSSSGDTPPSAVRPLQTLQTAADAGSSRSRRPRFLSRRRYKRAQMSSRSTVAFPGVKSERDVEQRLRGRSSLAPEELKEVLGSERDSLEELQAAEVSPDDERQ